MTPLLLENACLLETTTHFGLDLATFGGILK
jgi:hypothetical protein